MHEYKTSCDLETYPSGHSCRYATKGFLGDNRSKPRQKYPSCWSKKIRDTAGDQLNDTWQASIRRMGYIKQKCGLHQTQVWVMLNMTSKTAGVSTSKGIVIAGSDELQESLHSVAAWLHGQLSNCCIRSQCG